jgi:lipopolysaccharide/colanic/teichoic acid biosynthesis glycosyltransferase
MRPNAEDTGPMWATLRDERVTRVGAFLRRLKLDELPQFINVLLGQMSIVGPRPERPVFVETLRRLVPHYDARHSVRPGLTGWGTVKVGYGNSVEAKYLTHQYDLYQLRHRTIAFDLEIILRSVTAILFRAERQDRFML